MGRWWIESLPESSTWRLKDYLKGAGIVIYYFGIALGIVACIIMFLMLLVRGIGG